MTNLVDWFTREIRELGYAGLEGVYDYLATMSDEQVLEYLQSLLGAEKRITDFATSYIQRRSQGTQNQPSTTTQSSPNDAEFNWGQTRQLAPKAKRNKGRQRKTEKGSHQSKQERKSFAKAVSKNSAPPLNTEQARAIRDAPAERARQQLREYRRTKRPINCIYCGKIESPVPEDGACSFCGAPLFSVWQTSDRRRGPATTSSKAETRSSRVCRKPEIKYSTVLGRYVRRPIPYKDVYVQPELWDLAGNKYGSCVSSKTEPKTNASQSSKLTDPHSNNSVSGEVKEQSGKPAHQAKRTSKSKSPADGDYAVRGRLLVDDLRPSVCLTD